MTFIFRDIKEDNINCRGYDRLDHSREYELRRLGNVGARAMGRGYTVGSAAKVLYPAAGGSDDWAFGGAQIPYSYTIGKSWLVVHCDITQQDKT